MTTFSPRSDGSITATITQSEAVLLSSLATQVAALLGAVAARSDDESLAGTGIGGSLGQDDDPAVRRLLPDAYGDDDEAAQEFRRLTERDLATRKIGNAAVVIQSLSEIVDRTALAEDDEELEVEGLVSLDEDAALAWLLCLTDIRLTVAARLGIEDDDEQFDEETSPPEARVLYEISYWVAGVSQSIIWALDKRLGSRARRKKR